MKNKAIVASLLVILSYAQRHIELDVEARRKPQKVETLSLIEQQSNAFVEKDLIDYADIQIFTKLFFGSNREPHTLIFDTGSSWLWVQTPECTKCSN